MPTVVHSLVISLPVILLGGLGGAAGRQQHRASRAAYSATHRALVGCMSHHSYRPREGVYRPPPPDLTLTEVGAVIKDSAVVRDFWRPRLPRAETIQAWKDAYPPRPSYDPQDIKEDPYAQLTVRGAEELRDLGHHLRKRYIRDLTFLPPELDREVVYARATNIRRTQQSAQNLLLGMYPEGSLPIEVRLQKGETLYPNADRKCPRQDEILTQIRLNHYNLEGEEKQEYEALRDDAMSRLGIGPFMPWNQVREVLSCWQAHEYELPAEVDHDLINKIVRFTSRMWLTWFSNKEMLRLGIGKFLHELLTAVDARVEGRSTHKLLVYAGHDSTIIPVAAAFGAYDGVWPLYAANVVLEIARCAENEHYVRVMYNDQDVFSIDGGQAPVWCPMAQFREHMRSLIPEDYERECRCKESKETKVVVQPEDGISATISGSDQMKP